MNGWTPARTLNSQKQVEGADWAYIDLKVHTSSTCPLEVHISTKMV
jgi:hypothetical protein